MNKIILILITTVFLSCLKSHGQAVLFSEGFESGEIPLNWTEVYQTSSAKWKFQDGGYSFSGPLGKNPLHAYEGSYNAMFNYMNLNSKFSKLITCPIDMQFAVKPELHFYHAQIPYDTKNDKLYVYYKNGPSGNWTELVSYIEPTPYNPEWVERIVVLPDAEPFSSHYYLMFKGVSGNAYGTCIDNVSIINTGVLNKHIDSVYVEQASITSVASGTQNNPVLRLRFKVTGNAGNCPLNSLVLNSLNTSDNDIDGVKLFFTDNETFNTDNQIGVGKTFSDGQVSFTSLNYELPTGYSYVWVAYDIKSSVGHRNTIDASFNQNSININNITFPDVPKSPDGSRNILQAIYSDNFDGANNWTLSGEFEIGTPQGLGGNPGNPDPTNAFSGSKVLGTDLSGLGSYLGNYEDYLMDDQYTAVSDTFDFTYYNDVTLRYFRYGNFEYNDKASIDVSNDLGVTWTSAWENSSLMLDDKWSLQEINIGSLVSRKKNVLIRYSLGPTNDYWQLSGWNIDDFALTGNFVTNDVGISALVTPVAGCGHSGPENVTVIISNYGAEASQDSIPLKFSFDNNITVYSDTLLQSIPYGESRVFTFKNKVDLSNPGIYNFIASTDMKGDEEESNNSNSKIIVIQPTISTENTETFESNGGLWMINPISTTSWKIGVPSGITPPSGTKTWTTKTLTNYLNNDSSFVESVCYSNSNTDRKIVRFKYWVSSEENKDGAALQYSLDNGNTWALLDTIINGWSWYNDTIQALNSRGWSKTSEKWMDAAIILPKKLTDAPMMKFRMAFASDDENNSIGFAFDNFSILKAPIDIGISRIAEFTDACQEVNPDYLTVDIKNYGLNKLKQDDSIIAGFELNHTTIITDTIRLQSDISPGQILSYTFTKDIKDLPAGNYNITTYTLSEKDPWFYHANNDTLLKDFEVYPAPITTLIDTIQTRQPDTVKLRPYFNVNYSYLWQDGKNVSEYDVEHRGWHIVTVTDNASSHLCSLKDSTYVELLFNDVGASDLISPVTHCGLSTAEFVTVGIKNCGTDSILAGQKVAVSYELNGGAAVTDTLILTKTLRAYKVVPFTISKVPIDMSEAGTFHFKIYASYGGDTVTINDTIERTVYIKGRPVVTLGSDRVIQAISYALDPGIGYESYLWDNGETDQTRTISASGNYWVRVYDDNGCDSQTDVDIWLKIRDMSPAGLINPVSSCTFNPNEPVSLRITNSGTDTIPDDTWIDVSYLLNEGTRVTQQTQLSNPLLPGQNITYTFPGNINLNTEGDYILEATAVIAGDIRTTNDTAEYTVYRYPKPVVDFGLPNSIPIYDVSLNLDAGESPYYNYIWQDNSTEHDYTVINSGLYHVRATDTRTQCFDRDTVIVTLIFSDIGIISTDLVTSGCTGTYPHIKVRVKNLGTTNIGPSYPINIACDVKGSRVALDTLVRTGQFNVGGQMDLILSADVLISEGGINDIAFYTIYNDDKKHQNDTLHVVFDALQGPVIDFGDVNGYMDNIILPHTLDAGNGHKSYLWNDNSINQTFDVIEPGTYSVLVTGQNNCQNTKTVHINLMDPVETPVELVKEMIIYPNPNNGLFRVNLDNGVDEEFIVQIINNQGQVVFVKTCNTIELNNEFIDVQHLPRGLYYLIIQTKKQLYKGKILISFEN